MEALFLHRQAHAIRRECLGPEHRDVGLSLSNAANALAQMDQYHYAITLWERSLEILKVPVGDNHHLSQGVAESLQQCKQLELQAIQNKSVFGLVLLVFNSLPTMENPPDPTSSIGAHVIAQEIRNTLIALWNDALKLGSSTPVLIVSCPGYENAVTIALDESITKRYPASLLTWLKIPEVSQVFETPEVLLPVLSFRQQFLGWLQIQNIDALVAKPITSFGANLNRANLEFVQRGPWKGSEIRSEANVNNSNASNQEYRAMAIEVVPFDKLNGPLLGLFTGDKQSRPCVIPTWDWRQQNYTPKLDDERATGVIYLSVSKLRDGFSTNPETGLTPLDEWSMELLIKLAAKPREDQLPVFESALSDLMIVVETTPIECPAEKGIRGFPGNSLNREVEDLLK